MNVPATNQLAGAQYGLAVAKKVQQSVQESERQALQLIEAAAAPKVSANPNIGTRLDVRA